MPALYRCRAALSEIRELFECETAGSADWPNQIWPGRTAPIILVGSEGRALHRAHWGIYSQPGPSRHLKTSELNFFSDIAFRRSGAPPMRCLIPLDSFAVPSGPKGRRTRTWYGLWDQNIFAWAGLCRNPDDFGICFFGAMGRANSLVARTSQVMPILLKPDRYDIWLHGTAKDIREIWRGSFPAEEMWCEETGEAWTTGRDLAEDRRGN